MIKDCAVYHQTCMRKLSQAKEQIEELIEQASNRLVKRVKTGLSADDSCFVICPFCHGQITNQNIQDTYPFITSIALIKAKDKKTASMIAEVIKNS